MLIHCLAHLHLKVQDLRDDTEATFVEEFHRGLAIVCDYLFFARYRRSCLPASENERAHNITELLDASAKSAQDNSTRSDVVGDLLDLKLLRGSSHFSREGLVKRLSKYNTVILH